MVLVEIADWGLGFGVWFLDGKRCKEHCNSIRMHL